LNAVERVRQHLDSRHSGVTNQQLAGWLNTSQNEIGYLRRIAVKTGTQTFFIRVEDVDYVESAGNYTVVIVGKANHLLRETLTHLEDSLPPRKFLRISRSILVNLERIKSLLTSPTGEPIIVLQDNRQLKTTRNAREIQNKLQYADFQG
jgi:two-component system LytT family response regulator